MHRKNLPGRRGPHAPSSGVNRLEQMGREGSLGGGRGDTRTHQWNPAAPPFVPAGGQVHQYHPPPPPSDIFTESVYSPRGPFSGAPAPPWYPNHLQVGQNIYQGVPFMRYPPPPSRRNWAANAGMETPTKRPRGKRGRKHTHGRGPNVNAGPGGNFGADTRDNATANSGNSHQSNDEEKVLAAPPSPGSHPRPLDLRFGSEWGGRRDSLSSLPTNSDIPFFHHRPSSSSIVEEYYRPTVATWEVQPRQDHDLTPRARSRDTMSERAAPPVPQQGPFSPSKNEPPANNRYSSPVRISADRGIAGTPTRNPLMNRGMGNSTRGLTRGMSGDTPSTSSQGDSGMSAFNPAANPYNPPASRNGPSQGSNGMSSFSSSGNASSGNTYNPAAQRVPGNNNNGGYLGGMSSNNSCNRNIGNMSYNSMASRNNPDISTGTTSYVNTSGNAIAANNSGNSTDMNTGNAGYVNTGGNSGASPSTNVGNRNTGAMSTGYDNTGGNAGASNNLSVVPDVSSPGPAPGNLGFHGNIGGLAGSSLPAFVAIVGRQARGNVASSSAAAYNQMALQVISDNTSISIAELSRPNVDPFGPPTLTNLSSLLTPADGMSRKLRELTEGGRITPTGDAALDVYFLPFIPLCSRQPNHCRYGVIIIKNIPYTLTRSEVLAFVGRTAKIVPESENESIHIIMERVTSKTLDCYVEFTSVSEAIAAVERFQNLKMSGRSGRLGPRHVEVELSSQEELMRQLFPKAKNVKWVGITPTIIPKDPNDIYNSGFQGFISSEELVMLVKHVESPQRSPFARECPQRPFESIISTLSKYPWHMTNHITLSDRMRLFEATVKLVKFLLQRIREEYDPVHLNNSLLKRVIKACLACEGFTPVMKDDIVYWTSLDGRRAYELGQVPHADGWAAIHTLGAKKDVEYDLLMFYVKLIHDWTMKNARRPTLAQQAERGYSGFHATTMFGRVEQFLDLVNAVHPKTLGQATLAEVAVREWAVIEQIIRDALPASPRALQ